MKTRNDPICRSFSMLLYNCSDFDWGIAFSEHFWRSEMLVSYALVSTLDQNRSPRTGALRGSGCSRGRSLPAYRTGARSFA